jgi:glycosyltransferase involved in cell wall biosynthesis
LRNERASFLLTHPHAAAFATGLAARLEANGALAVYMTGVVAAGGTARARLVEMVGRLEPAALNRILNGVPAARLRSLAIVEGAARTWARITGRRVYDALFVAHDAAVAASSWPRGVTGVYAYEDGALRTFRRARRAGLERVWDLPLPHHRTMERILSEEHARWPDAALHGAPHEPEWKRRRKDEELELATKVSVASRFTRESLEAAGVTAPVVVVPYGFPVDRFSARPAPPAGPFTVLSVGTHDLRKGTPYLLEAWRRAGLREARLRLVGPIRLSERFLSRYAGTFEHVPHVAKARLGDEYGAADLLAFPTLGDGFGLVIQEAMACGTPVVTTRCGGGPECITEGVDGWIVPEGDADALADRFRAAARERDLLARMGRAARQRAESFGWREAGDLYMHALGVRPSYESAAS